MEPKTPKELYWAKMAGEDVTLPEPKTPEEAYLSKMAGEDVTLPDPKTPKEYYMKSVAENGGFSGTSDALPLFSAPVTATYVFNKPEWVTSVGVMDDVRAVHEEGDVLKSGFDYDSTTQVAVYNSVGIVSKKNVMALDATSSISYNWFVDPAVQSLYQVYSVVPSDMVNITIISGTFGDEYAIIDPTKPASLTWTVTLRDIEDD